jgi:hypothetical protein
MDKTKKILLKSVFFCTALTGILFAPKAADAKNNGDFVIKNGVLTEYTGFDDDVVIPDGVKSIGNSTFYENDMTSVTIPDSVKSIGKYAFKECESLSKVTIPKSVTSIGSGAFDRTVKIVRK